MKWHFIGVAHQVADEAQVELRLEVTVKVIGRDEVLSERLQSGANARTFVPITGAALLTLEG